MPSGESFSSRGQRYDMLDSFEHERPATWVRVFALRTTCPECCVRFECTATKTQPKNKLMPRRCGRWRAPGRPVSSVKTGRENSSVRCASQTF
jgi:hypothetical protein